MSETTTIVTSIVGSAGVIVTILGLMIRSVIRNQGTVAAAGRNGARGNTPRHPQPERLTAKHCTGTASCRGPLCAPSILSLMDII